MQGPCVEAELDPSLMCKRTDGWFEKAEVGEGGRISCQARDKEGVYADDAGPVGVCICLCQ